MSDVSELGVVFDAGTAMFRVRKYLTTDGLDIFLTHAHLDHVFGLTFMFDILHGREMHHVTVHAEDEKLKAIKEHLFSELLFPVAPPFETETLAEKVTLADGGVLTHFPLKHPGGSIGYRIDWQNRSFAYVTDTIASTDADYVKLIEGVDLLVHECYFGEESMSEHAELTGHSWLRPVAEVAAAAKVGRLVLVHMNPLADNDDEFDLEAARKIFPNIELGHDEMEVEF